MASAQATPDTSSDEVHPGTDIEKIGVPVDSNPVSTSLAQRPSTVSWILTCLGLYLGALLYGLDTTIAADVQGSIYEDLGNITKLPWVGIGFPMGSVAIILLVGKFYGTFEIKWLILTSIFIFEAGSALCGAAPNTNALIVGRVIAGTGGAGMFLGALTYISVFTTLRERALYNALIGLAWGTGAILGPVIGGAFSVSSATWRWAFYINLPLAAVLSPVYFFIFPRYQPQPDRSVASKLKQLDWVGAFLNAGTFVLFMVVLTFSGSSWAWSSAKSIVLWVLFGVFVTAYILQQVFCIFTTEESRLFPVQFTKSRTFLLMYFTSAAAATGTSVAIYYVPLFFQFTKGDTALEAAVRLLPLIIMFVVAVMFTGAILPLSGRYVLWYYPAGIFMTVGGALMFVITPTTPTANIYGFEVLMAVGSGLLFQNAYAILAAKVADKDVPDTIGFVNVAQIGSIAIALSIAGAVFQNVGYKNLTVALAAYDFPEEYIRGALAGAVSTILHGNEKVEQLAIGAIVDAIRQVFGLVIGAGALTLVCAAFMSWEKLQLDPSKA